MSAYRTFINYFLGIIKYPLVLLLLFSLPDMLMAFPEYYEKYMVASSEMQKFFMGSALFLVLYGFYILFARSFHIPYFGTLVHEFTHLIFIYLCGNYATSIVATFKNGGRVMRKYEGNWLISISPYFFPSFSVFLMVLMSLKGSRPENSVFLLGFVTAFQVISNYIQIHPGQTDFKRAGYLFTALFLLPANVLMWGIILSYVDNGGAGMMNFLYLSFRSFLNIVSG